MLRGAEVAAVLLLLAAALVPRVRYVDGPWDREFDGFQGSAFTLFAINYERLGLDAHGGYPAFNVDLPGDPEVHPYVYANHPPLVPLLCWATLSALGPEGWDTAWRDGRPPPHGTERALRAPFLIGNLLSLLALWWCVRGVAGSRTALVALALGAAVPIHVVYGYLVNYENLVWPPLLLGVGMQLRHLRNGDVRLLWWAGAAFLLASCVTFTPAFLVPPLALQALLYGGLRPAVRTGAVLSVAALAPAAAHGAWVRRSLPPELASNVFERVERMVAPLLDGSAPLGEWLRRQLVRAAHYATWPLLLLALAGLVVVLVRRSRRGRSAPPSAGPPLLCGGVLLLLAFYKHTWDGAGPYDAQTVFQLDLVPGLVVLAAEALGALGRPLLRLRGGDGPLVLVVLAVVLPMATRGTDLQDRWRRPGPNDSSPSDGPAVPLPSTVGPSMAAALPAGAVGLYPAALALTAATPYYAWRTLVPSTPATYDLVLDRVASFYGLGDRPHFALIPKDPTRWIPPSAPGAAARFAEIEAIRSILSEAFDPVAETADWELWPAPPPSPPAAR